VVDWTEITVTSRCNQRCFFCYEAVREVRPDPPLARIKRLLRETRRHSEQVVFCGREALLRSDIFDMVAYAHALGLRAVVFTNGQALARADRVARLVEAGCSAVAVSFHFPDAATFATGARVSPRCFDRVLEGLRNVRDHNRAHPERRLAVSTETDMFSLNAGRLQEMRRTLLEALGDSGWSMRLAGLLPMRVHDIGLPTLVDSLATRREEVADFVRTHPPGVALGFVKVPLCLLPEGEEYRSLDVQYVHAGTRMTFNHLALERIDVDRFSVTNERALESPLRRHPYRWVCRTCALLPMCRFHRVSWTDAGFLPDRANRPLPYRPERPATGATAGFGLPHRTRSAADVLSPLGADPGAVERVSAACGAAAEQAFPEEEILRTLRDAPEGEPILVDAWTEATPVLAIELEHRKRRLRLGLGAPGVRTDEPCAIVDYLSVHPLEGEDPPLDLLRRALRRLASVPLPDVGRWSADPWFDAPTARRRRAIWRRFREILWPGIGRIGPWRTAVVRSDPSTDVEVQLEHASGARAELAWRTEEGAPDLALGLTLRRLDSGVPQADVVGLLAAIRKQVTGQAGTVPRPPAASREIALHLRRDRWVRGSPPGVVPAVGVPPVEDELVLQVRRGDTRVVEFHVAQTRAGRPIFRRVGALSLWYGQAALDGPALAWARLVLSAMRRLQGQPLRAAAVRPWRAALSELARHNPWTREFQWSVEWRAAVGSAAESPAHG
jgi:uncharacterized Fe-S cluster-containing radical SAM superfamily protein